MFVVFGSTNVDLFIGGIEQLPGLGREEFAVDNLAWCAEPLRMVIGGNGANSAYILGKLGANVRLASAIGEDLLGNVVYDWLKAAGVDQSWLRRRTDTATATTTIVSDAARQRLSFHHPGAYATYVPEDLPEGWAQAVRVLLITGYPLLRGLRPDGCRALLAAARQAGAITALDVGPAIGAPVTRDELGPLLPLLDYLIANEYEAGLLAAGAPGERAGLAAAAAGLLAQGAQGVVVRQGAAGATLFSRAVPLHAPAQPCDVRQTVGAGDAFNGGFLYGLAQGLPVSGALSLGNRVAAQVVSTLDGVLGFHGLTADASMISV
jgi:sugar/nucleoside kinase (ribokinase family)